MKRSRSLRSWRVSFLALEPCIRADNRSRDLENRFENTQPSRYPYLLLKRDTWSIIPILRILLRTVSRVRGENPYLSERGARDGMNSPGAYFSSMKIDRKTFWWFLLPGNKILATSSNPWILAILLWFSSIFVDGIFFTPAFLMQIGRSSGFWIFPWC